MNLALILHSGFRSSLQEMKRWLGTHHSSDKWAPSASPQAGSMIAPTLIARCATPKRVDTHKLALRQPLRVVRVLEAGQPRACVGRMVISGRMADVCAELDRLAARETALS